MTQNRSRSGIWVGLGIVAGVLFTLLLLAGTTIYALGCAIGKVGEALQTDTRVEARAMTANGPLELELSYGDEVTGITTITFTDDEGNTLWEVAGQGSA